MVEFALVLPILVALLLFTIDFGRVFFHWVALTNGARVAANYAALHPTAWVPGNPAEQAGYVAQVRDELRGSACEGITPPDPTFPEGTGLGAHAVVTLECPFTPVTPFITNLFGNPITISADSSFPIRAGCSGCPSPPAPTPTPPPAPTSPPCERVVPDLSGLTVAAARNAWSAAGFTGSFSPNGHNNDVVTGQNPLADTNQPCNASMVVSYEPAPTPAPTCGVVPNMVGMTVANARSAWSGAGFTGTFTPAAPTGDSQIVATQTTSPASAPGDCIAFTATATVTYAPASSPPPPPECRVPNFIGTRANDAQAAWTAAGFTTTMTRQGNGNFRIQYQSLVGGSLVPCSASITVRETP